MPLSNRMWLGLCPKLRQLAFGWWLRSFQGSLGVTGKPTLLPTIALGQQQRRLESGRFDLSSFYVAVSRCSGVSVALSLQQGRTTYQILVQDEDYHLVPILHTGGSSNGLNHELPSSGNPGYSPFDDSDAGLRLKDSHSVSASTSCFSSLSLPLNDVYSSYCTHD